MKKISVSELSIGDWVCAISGTRETPPMRVVGLGEDWVNLEIDPEQGDAFEYSPDEIRGIPITPEILEKNGFRQSEIGKMMILEICKGQHIGIVNTRFGFCFFAVYSGLGKCGEVANMPILYIHELQHCLRMLRTEKDITL